MLNALESRLLSLKITSKELELVRKKSNGTYRAPKQIADAMGHTLDVHLKSYARFMTKELAENFDQEILETIKL